MPGVQVFTNQKPAPSERNPDPAGRYMVAGVTERGPADTAQLVRSLGEYVDRYGQRVSYGSVYDDLAVFFGEGGGEAYVARVVGPAATKGFLTLVDRAGSPLSTLKIEALGVGASSADLSVAVSNGVAANTYIITVYLLDTSGIPQVVEQTGPLSTPGAAVTALADSLYVRAIDQASATAAPNNIPAVLTRTALSAGTDDRASITDTHRVNALALFTADLGAGAVAVPGSSSSTVNGGLITHAQTYSRVALLSGAQGASTSTVSAAATALRASAGAEYAAFIYPWVQISDGSGGLRTVSPQGFVAGRRAATARTVGVWQPAAGAYGRSVSGLVRGVENKLQQDTIDTLYESSVNSIVLRQGVATVYGWRSLTPDRKSWDLLSVRDLLNDIVYDAKDRLEAFLFFPINDRLSGEVENELRSLLQPILDAGGLAPLVDASGSVTDEGYVVDAGPALNPPSVQQTNTLKAALSVRPAASAANIVLYVTKAAPGVSF